MGNSIELLGAGKGFLNMILKGKFLRTSIK